METVVATGIIRQIAQKMRDGIDVDTALRESSQGASKPVKDLVLERIHAAMPKVKKITPDAIGKAILAAEAQLP